jgi:hypothetical protein
MKSFFTSLKLWAERRYLSVRVGMAAALARTAFQFVGSIIGCHLAPGIRPHLNSIFIAVPSTS